MKTYHYILVLIAIIGIWYFRKKRNKSGSYCDFNPNLHEIVNADNSENANVATMTKKEALEIAKANYEDFSLTQDLGDTPEYKWTLGYSDENGEWHNEILSKDTFDALVAAGYEADYN